MFENYIIFDEYKERNGWDYSKIATTIVFGEENYTIKYFNKSISGYLRNYFRKDKGIKRVLNGSGNIVGMFKVGNVFEKFTVLQIGISRFFDSKEDLLEINDKFYRQLTPKQKELLKNIEEVVDFDDILFYRNGLPYFKWINLTDKTYIPETTIKTIFEQINNRINEIKNNKDYKFCECCGIKIKRTSNRIKYCEDCKRKFQLWHQKRSMNKLRNVKC